jgi:hypothetical protein
MKSIVIIAAFLLSITTGAFAQHLKSATGHDNNPYYSNTDTKKAECIRCGMEKDPAIRALCNCPRASYRTAIYRPILEQKCQRYLLLCGMW